MALNVSYKTQTGENPAQIERLNRLSDKLNVVKIFNNKNINFLLITHRAQLRVSKTQKSAF